MRLKFNSDLEEKKLRIAYLNNEKHEMTIKMTEMEKELNEFKNIFENSKKEYIEYLTQIKILKQSLTEKNENIEMITEEVQMWMYELYKERLSHYNTQQNVTALEVKIQTIQKERTTNKTSTLIIHN
jgi:chromosome segregation ATPase